MKRILIIIICLIFISFFPMHIDAAYIGNEINPAEKIDLVIKDYKGKTYNLNNFKTKNTIVILGRMSCGTTAYTLKEAEKLAKKNSITIIELFIDNESESYTMDEFQSLHPNVIISNNYKYNKQKFAEYCYKYDYADNSFLPVVLILNNNGELIYTTKGINAEVNLSIGLAYANDKKTYKDMIKNAGITYDGYFNYDKSYAILNEINELRKEYENYEPIIMDKDLFNAACIRAMEIRSVYENYRPNNTLDSDLSDKIYGTYYNKKDFSIDPNNEGGMIWQFALKGLSAIKSIGIGIFKDSNNDDEYIYVFYSTSKADDPKKSGLEYIKKTIEIHDSNFDIRFKDDSFIYDEHEKTRIDIGEKEKVELRIELKRIHDKIYPDKSDFLWEVKDKNIASVTNDGIIKGLKEGETDVIVKNKLKPSVSITRHVVVYDKSANNVEKCELNTDVGWEYLFGKHYWYEKKNGRYVKQAIIGDPKNIWDKTYGIERGREIYDPCSDGWYWLDTVYEGAKAENKEVWVPYIYQDEDSWNEQEIKNISIDSDYYMEKYFGIIVHMSDQVYDAIKNKTGKWVRYDENGKMIKGWYTVYDDETYPGQYGNKYYYDYKTGLMAKGWTYIDGENYYFDPTTGILQE